MATNTTNYNLIKPDQADFYDVANFNSNADIIDSALASKVDSQSKPATFVIGLSGVHTLKQADYLADNTAGAEVVINQAIAALPAGGGKILLLAGTYQVKASIALNVANSVLAGLGSATVLQRAFDGFGSNGIINISAIDCSVENMKLDGAKATYTYANNCGVYLTAGNAKLSKLVLRNNNYSIYGNAVSDCLVAENDSSENGYGIHLSSGSGNIVKNNICNDNTLHGIYISSGGGGYVVSGNVCNGNTEAGIRIQSASQAAVTGNVCNGNGSGLYCSALSYCTIAGNTANNNDIGFYLAYGSMNNIHSNTFMRDNGTPADYSASQYTMQFSTCSQNLISGNLILGKNIDPADGDGVGNTVFGNKFSDVEMPFVGDSPIVESGGNTNGNYVKYADGTMICWKTSFEVTYSTVNECYTVWNLPVPFVGEEPYTQCQHRTELNVGRYATTGTRISAAGLNVALVRTLSVDGSYVSNTVMYVNVLAIGKWK